MLEQVNDNNIEKMRKSFFKYLIPSMVATVLIGLYIVVDGYFIGNAMGDIGLAAINLVYPIGSILYSFGMMIGIGGAVLMSISLGSNDLENFNKVKVNTFLTLIFGSVILTIILFIFKNNLITLLGAKGEIFDETNNYITIIILASFSQTMSSGCIPMIRNYGKTIHAMSFMATGLIINIILDYFFIYVLRWGMRGAAFATVSAQFVVVILSIYYLFIKKDHRMRIRFSDYDFNTHQLKDRRITVRFFHVFGYDITNGELHTEVDVNYIYGDRYINLNMPHAYFIAELGYYDDNNMFLVLARSNMIYAPRDTMSSIYDEEWLVNEDIVKILKTTPALRESLSSATICELLDLRQNHLSSSSLFKKKEVLL